MTVFHSIILQWLLIRNTEASSGGQYGSFVFNVTESVDVFTHVSGFCSLGDRRSLHSMCRAGMLGTTRVLDTTHICIAVEQLHSSDTAALAGDSDVIETEDRWNRVSSTRTFEYTSNQTVAWIDLEGNGAGHQLSLHRVCTEKASC